MVSTARRSLGDATRTPAEVRTNSLSVGAGGWPVLVVARRTSPSRTLTTAVRGTATLIVWPTAADTRARWRGQWSVVETEAGEEAAGQAAPAIVARIATLTTAVRGHRCMAPTSAVARVG
jgi:hypothetical protein